MWFSTKRLDLVVPTIICTPKIWTVLIVNFFRNFFLVKTIPLFQSNKAGLANRTSSISINQAVSCTITNPGSRYTYAQFSRVTCFISWSRRRRRWSCFAVTYIITISISQTQKIYFLIGFFSFVYVYRAWKYNSRAESLRIGSQTIFYYCY